MLGTLNTPIGRESSEKYAKKMEISDRPEIVLLPKSTGLYHCAKTLVPYTQVLKLFDVTVGYSGLKVADVPYDKYLIEEVFFNGIYPKQVHMHIRSYNWDVIPGFSGEDLDKYNDETKESFNLWLRKRYLEKDELMRGFYENHRFSVSSNPIIIKIAPTWTDLFGVGFLWISVFWMVPFYWGLLMRLLLK